MQSLNYPINKNWSQMSTDYACAKSKHSPLWTSMPGGRFKCLFLNSTFSLTHGNRQIQGYIVFIVLRTFPQVNNSKMPLYATNSEDISQKHLYLLRYFLYQLSHLPRRWYGMFIHLLIQPPYPKKTLGISPFPYQWRNMNELSELYFLRYDFLKAIKVRLMPHSERDAC